MDGKIAIAVFLGMTGLITASIQGRKLMALDVKIRKNRQMRQELDETKPVSVEDALKKVK